MDYSVEPGPRVAVARDHIWTMALMWTLLVGASAAWNELSRRRDIEETGRTQARTALDMDIAFRHWNAMHGGVYVPVTKETQPNPDLAGEPERDITTPSGKRLTLMNPAYMTRQAHELLRYSGGVQAHITSLKPLRPQNTPDAFEAQALQAFENGQDEFSAIEESNGQECMRLMRPLVTEKSCLKCHASQGYREGDIRGGIGIAVPMAPLRAMRGHSLQFVLWTMLIWAAGLGGLAFRASRELRAVAKQGQAEEKLRQSEQKYRALVEGSNDVVYSVTADGTMDFVGPQISKYGYAESDVLSHSLFDFIYPEDREVIGAVLKDRICSGNSSPVEFRAVAKDGRVVWLLDNGRVRGDAAGKIVGLTGVLTDITERKRAEEALRESEERYRELILNQGEGLAMADTEERFTFVNPAGAEIFGVPAESLVGRALKDFMTPDQYALVLKETERRRAGAKSTYELEIVRPDGERRCLLLTAVPHTDKAGGYLGALGLFRDITARKRAEQALRESERRISEALEFNKKILAVPSVGILTYRESGQCTFANEAAAKIVGTDVAGLLAQNFHQLQSWKKCGMYEAALEALRTDTQQHLEASSTTSFGRNLWVDLRFSSFQSAGEKHLLVFLHDTTERKRAEQALREREEQQRKILHTALDGFWIAKYDGRLQEVNEAYCRMSGYNREELCSMRISDLEVNEPSPAHVSQHMAKVVQAGCERFESRHRTKDRRLMDVEVAVASLDPERGLVFAFLRDITARKRAEEALKASEAQLKEAQRLAQIGSWTLALETGVSTWSEELYRIFGKDPTLPAPSLKDLPSRYTPESCRRIQETIRQAMETGQPYQVELELVRLDGARRWVVARGEAVRDSNGRVAKLLGTVQDITERKRVESEAQALREQLYHARRITMMGEFVATIAHELNQPLTAIVGNARAAQRFLAAGKLGEQGFREILDDIAADGQRAGQVLQRIRERLRKGRLDRKFLDLNTLVREVAELLPRETLDRDVEVALDLAPELPMVRADQVQLQQVILNLMTNAFESMETAPRSERRLTIRTSRVDAQRVQLAVEDTGVGIPPDKLAHVFEPFFTTKSAGTGMGLAICHSIIFAHGGRIWASNNAGRGATVQFVLPINEGSRYDAKAVT